MSELTTHLPPDASYQASSQSTLGESTLRLSDAQLERLIEQPSRGLEALEGAREALGQLRAVRREVYQHSTRESEQIARCEARLEGALTGTLKVLSAQRHLPFIVALTGGTNTGKSATLNLLAGREVSQEKMSANATKRPLIYAHERWREALMSAERPWATPRLAYEPHEPLQRADSTGEQMGEQMGHQGPLLSLHSDDRLVDLVLIDSPDLDSTASENTYSAAEVVSWAERALFVVTPHKYKDALLVDALGGLLARAYPVSVLFNRVSASEHLAEMQSDLQESLGVLGASAQERGSLSFTPATPKLSLAARREPQGVWREALLKALEPQDRTLERRERLKARLGEVSVELTQLSVLLSEGSKAARDLERSLSELITHEAQEEATGYTPPLERSTLRAQLQQLSLSALLSHPSALSSTPRVSSGEGAALRASLSLLTSALKGGLSRLHDLLISDALVRCGLSPHNTERDERRRVEALLKIRGALIEHLDAQHTFSADALSPSPQGAQALHAQRRLEAEVREAIGLDEAPLSSHHQLLKGALLEALERKPISELEREAREVVNNTPERPQTEQVTLWASARVEAWLFKGALAVFLSLLTFGLGPWDLLWAPVGFELGVYPLAWRATSWAKRERSKEAERAEGRRCEERAHALYLAPLEPLLAVQERAQLSSSALHEALKDLQGGLQGAVQGAVQGATEREESAR